MGGTVKGRVDCVLTLAPNGNQEHFTNLKQFFDDLVTAGYGAIHASNYGSGGTGFDFHDGANPSGENAFFVFEWATSTARPGGGSAIGKYYTLVQWADASNFGTAPGNPGLLNGAAGFDGVGICSAFLEDGNSPWNGGTAAAGADAKGTPVWTAGASTLHVLDYSNTPTQGNHDTNFENCLSLGDVAGFASSRCHFIADEDNLVCLFDQQNDGSYQMHYVGMYTPHTHVTANYPMICMHDVALPYDLGLVYGSAGGTGTRDGLIISADVQGPGGGSFTFDRLQSILGATVLQPNPQAPTKFDEVDITVYQNDSGKALYGWAGNVDFIRECYNAATHEANAALDRACFGTTVVNSIKITTPWGTASPPGTGAVRTGRSF
jgi:hypothetical protein